ncbi:MAG TPA: homoserine kinase [Limnochordales bacterium]|nr:homoserine kinase [Limnochordales bacterium]
MSAAGRAAAPAPPQGEERSVAPAAGAASCRRERARRVPPGRVRVRVPATTANLGPGFDALGMALSLFNYFDVELGPDGCQVDAEGEAAGQVPRGEDNLVIQAAQAVWARTGRPPTGWRVRVRAEIPFGCGLGSSASAIVGGAVAANVLAGEPLSTGELLAIAAGLEGHADNVTPALVGGFTVVAAGGPRAAGEEDGGPADSSRVAWVRLPARGLQAVVAIPAVQLPTRESRRRLPEQVRFQDAAFNVGRASLLVAAVATGDTDALAAALEDRLHQPYRAALVPGFHQVVQAAKAAGALGAVLSGAGPAVLALVPREEPAPAIGEAMAQAFRAAGVEARWMALAPDDTGARVEVPAGWEE